MFRLKGVVPPMITPFKKNGDVDYESLKKFVEYLSKEVDGLFICGSYGCGPLMTVEERKKVAEIVREYASEGTTIVVQTGTTTTKETIELTKHAREIGADAAAAVGPYYFAYTDIDLYQHFSAILKESESFPFYIYNNPKFQGYDISIKILKQLKNEGLSGIKDATFDIMKYAAYTRELADENFDIALGTEAMWVSAHALGCEAFIPGIGNVYPELCRKMWEESMRGDDGEALKTQFLINRLREVMYLARSTQLATYAIAEIRGIMSAYPRAPFIPATEEEKTAVRNALASMDIL